MRIRGPGGQPAFLTGVRREAVETGVYARRATEGPGDVLEQYVEEPDRAQRSRQARIRRRSRSPVGNAGQALLEIAIALPALLVLLAGAYACCRAAFISSSASSAAQTESIRSGRRLPGLEMVLAASILPSGKGVHVGVRSGKKGRLLPSPFPSLAGRTIGFTQIEKYWDETERIAALPPLLLGRQSEMSVDCWDKGSSSGKKVRRVVRARVALGIVR